MQFAQLAAITIVAISCYEVIRIFISAILFAAVVCISTWPLYLHLRSKLNNRFALAALLMVFLLLLLVITPSALVAISLADSVTAFVDMTKAYLSHAPIKPPTWIKDLPMFGGRLNRYWQGLASGGKESVALFETLFGPTRSFLLDTAKAVGEGLLQMVFATFIGFFLYRDGESLIQMVRDGLTKLAGDVGEEILNIIQHTVASVVHGIFGAALAQGLMATIGFFIAGVPGAFLLGAATFFLSLLPIGPPLLWGGASIWLLYQASYGWALFMLLWGVFLISSIDNFVRPYLISRDSDLSLLLVTLGVFGGIAAFGFIGVFIGPPVLAVGMTLIRLWTAHGFKFDRHDCQLNINSKESLIR